MNTFPSFQNQNQVLRQKQNYASCTQDMLTVGFRVRQLPVMVEGISLESSVMDCPSIVEHPHRGGTFPNCSITIYSLAKTGEIPCAAIKHWALVEDLDGS